MMQLGNLPLPLPILTPALHADFPSVHIGIKVSESAKDLSFRNETVNLHSTHTFKIKIIFNSQI